MDKLVKAFWYVTVFIVFGGLMYSFAGLPEDVTYLEGKDKLMRDTYFYSMLGIIAVTNFIFYAFALRFVKMKDSMQLASPLATWLFALNASFNLFYFVVLMYVMMHNSNEKWDFQILAYGAYFALAIIGASLFSLPVLIFYAKKNSTS